MMKIRIAGNLKRLLVVALAAGFVFAAANGKTVSVSAEKIASAFGAAEIYAGDENQIFNLINNERRKKRLSDLRWNDELSKIAQNYSKTMARNNFFSHYDRSGADVGGRVRASKIRNWHKLGENLFSCEGIEDYEKTAVKNWMKSAGHRQNILDKDWTETGIGIARDRNGKTFITQIFIEQ